MNIFHPWVNKIADMEFDNCHLGYIILIRREARNRLIGLVATK